MVRQLFRFTQGRNHKGGTVVYLKRAIIVVCCEIFCQFLYYTALQHICNENYVLNQDHIVKQDLLPTSLSTKCLLLSSCVRWLFSSTVKRFLVIQVLTPVMFYIKVVTMILLSFYDPTLFFSRSSRYFNFEIWLLYCPGKDLHLAAHAHRSALCGERPHQAQPLGRIPQKERGFHGLRQRLGEAHVLP